MKAKKGLTLALAPYKTVTIEVSDVADFLECDKELLKELDRMPKIKELNAEDIEAVFPNAKGKPKK